MSGLADIFYRVPYSSQLVNTFSSNNIMHAYQSYLTQYSVPVFIDSRTYSPCMAQFVFHSKHNRLHDKQTRLSRPPYLPLTETILASHGTNCLPQRTKLPSLLKPYSPFTAHIHLSRHQIAVYNKYIPVFYGTYSAFTTYPCIPWQISAVMAYLQHQMTKI